MRTGILAAGLFIVAAGGGIGAQDSLDFKESLVLSGLSRIPANKGLVECELEIRILLPDHYLRIDRAAFGEKRSGFDGCSARRRICRRVT